MVGKNSCMTQDHRLVHISLDASTVVKWSADVEHERRIAIYDLLEENSFELLKSRMAYQSQLKRQRFQRCVILYALAQRICPMSRDV